MPSLIKQGEARVVTKNGEVFVNIALELTIKLEGTALQAVTGARGGVETPAGIAGPADDKVNWQIPDFSPGKIDFGK